MLVTKDMKVIEVHVTTDVVYRLVANYAKQEAGNKCGHLLYLDSDGCNGFIAVFAAKATE